ncbi:MFS transporter [Streptomyces sp. WMMC1477]|uniref:MFS transporter n=1 Tax=Streptomyces sp. WMMC1477 TaxID=3015155 RepID=UPI0022B6E48C|nr:MFS transporter [Streptomyces sp. WMMC1477]MCZ7434254.1 MFS transporter [Streptomyces sp. WMMC1477]
MLYPLYAVLFADTGLSAAQISSLFILWSVAGFVLDVPTGVLADLLPRRALLVVAPLANGVGFALWTFLPSYPAFAAGFVLWGAGAALRSGTYQALAHTELARYGAAHAYERVIGRSRAAGVTAQLLAAALAAPVHAAGGYRALGAVSVAAMLLCAAVGRTLPASRPPAPEEGEEVPGFTTVLRGGLRALRHTPRARRAALLFAVVTGFAALDEYVPLLVDATGAGPAALPLLVGLVTAGAAAGGWLAGRGPRGAAGPLALGALCLAAGSLAGSPLGLLGVAVAFGVFEWATALTDARLQAAVPDASRATVTSLAGFGSELCAVLVFAGYAVGAQALGPGPVFAVCALPYLLASVSEFRQSRRRRARTLEE